jgi:hypothetical protein
VCSCDSTHLKAKRICVSGILNVPIAGLPFSYEIKVWNGLETLDDRKEGLLQLKKPSTVEGHEVGAIVPVAMESKFISQGHEGRKQHQMSTWS